MTAPQRSDPASTGDVRVADNPDADRYEITVGGELAGFLEYHSRPGLVAFVHTQIDDRFEGRGLGGKLVRAALDDARARGFAVLPFCPFVNAFIARHPDEYADLVPADHRERFGLVSA